MFTHFTLFKTPVEGIVLPKKFTFPFYYEPHILSKIASEELQEYLSTQTEIKHSFGLQENTHEIGKMFGVLVVQNTENKIGYLSAFSGNISNQNSLKRFVPPIYDIYAENSFFSVENKILIDLSEEIRVLENDPTYIELQKEMAIAQKKIDNIISKEKEKLRIRKKKRKLARKEQNTLTELFKQKQNQESINDRFYIKELTLYYKNTLAKKATTLHRLENNISILKQKRIQYSNTLQQKIAAQYYFLNNKGEEKRIPQLFDKLNIQAPGGTGDCAAPKLLQYAFLHGLKPIAMAEFWWGKPGNSAIRKHKNYYPSCKGKCEPILTHMLDGIVLEKNILLENLAKDKKIEVIFEDAYLFVINKPTELLSVPGKKVTDSVYTRFAKKYPEAKKHLIIHRLDMSTSGIMLLAKTKKAHQFLQSQFIKREIKKQYIALLDGIIMENEGIIELPLRVDLEDRPKQLVCFEHGKKAVTKWKVLSRKDKKTKVQFTPITGRTHQLRVHAAHVLGLNTPIVGDDLYGVKKDRLHLQAIFIEFIHPKTKKLVHFTLQQDF